MTKDEKLFNRCKNEALSTLYEPSEDYNEIIPAKSIVTTIGNKFVKLIKKINYNRPTTNSFENL